MDKSNIIIAQLSTLVQNDGTLGKKPVMPEVEGTDIPDPTSTSFVMYLEDGRRYEVSVKKVYEPDAEELEMIAHTKAFDLHGRPRR